MTEFIALIIAFLFFLILILPVMVIAYWPEQFWMRNGTRTTLGKVGRNDPCLCGSGKKAKKCCGAAALYNQDRYCYKR